MASSGIQKNLYKMGLPMGLMYLTGQVDEKILNSLSPVLKVLAVAWLVAMIYAVVVVRRQIEAAADQTPVTVTKDKPKKKKKKKAAKAVAAAESEPAAPAATAEPPVSATTEGSPAEAQPQAEQLTETITTQEYDMREWKKLVTSSVGGAAITSVLPSLGFGARSLVPALAGAAIGFFDQPLVRLHMLGHPITQGGELERPFKKDDTSLMTQAKKELDSLKDGSIDAAQEAREEDRLARERARMARIRQAEASSSAQGTSGVKRR